MVDKDKKPWKKIVKGIVITLITVFLLIYCIESNKFWLFLLGLMAFGAFKMRELYRSFFKTYWYLLKKAWNREGVDLQALLPTPGGITKVHTQKIYKDYVSKIKKKKKK